MAEELKACPFSGETPQTEYWSPSDGRHRDYSSGAWVVTIKSRFACVEKSSLLSRDDAESKAIEAWNTRAKLPSQGGEAVEVVCITQGGCNVTWTATKELTPAGTALMSVRQHRRILAAATHPADQVADDITMVKVSRELLERAIYNMELAEIDGPTYRELRSLLAKPCQHLPLTSQYGTWCELCETKLD